jgi:glycosyltransferase involved in cell wall biosynthesis
MESHPNIDILSSSILLGYKNDKVWDIGEYTVTLEHLKDGNRLIHPAVIMRTESLYKLPFYYEYYYESAEDYKLWVTAVLHGLTVCTERTPVIRYSRPRSGGIEQDCIAARIKNLCCQCINGIKESKQHEMTAIVTFRNEYEEIEKTIASIRATTKDMPIILLNDASDNDYDYKFVAEKYGCFYLEHSTPAGVAGGRIAAIKNVKTKYFIILDGHMRMYEDDWDLRAIDIIEKNGEDNVYFGRTAVISKTDRNNLINENGQKVINTYGACLAGETYPLVPKWITTPSTVNFDNNENIIPVPLLLGADYMMSVNFWNKIQGLNGLLCWGQDETLLSLKTWLSGSKVLLIKDMIFGHVYRKKRPYTTAPVEMNSNYIYCNYLFSRNEQEFNELNYLLEETLGKIYYHKTYKYFMKRFEEAKAFKEYFYNNIAERDMDWFWTFNYNADPKQVQSYYDKRDKILSKMIK